MCLVCSSLDYTYNQKYDLCLCNDCGFVWQPVAATDDLVEYDIEYFDKYLTYPLKRMAELRSDFIEKFLIGQFNVVLDVGFGTGDFLKEMHKRGYVTYGVEVNEKSWAEAPDYIKVYGGGKVDVTTFYDSLEHILNINEVLYSIDTKYLVVSIPNFKGMDNIEGWRHYRPGEHIYYFNQVTLEKYLRRFNFELIGSDFPEDEIRNTEKENILTAVFEHVQ